MSGCAHEDCQRLSGYPTLCLHQATPFSYPVVSVPVDYERTAIRTFGPCPKCAESDIRVRYHDGKKHCDDCPRIKSCEYTVGCGKNGTEGEHLAATCQRCGFSWVEEVTRG